MSTMATTYAARAKALMRDYEDLATNPSNPAVLRMQAANGLQALGGLLDRIRMAGQDLARSPYFAAEAYRVATLPMLEGQVLAMESHLNILKMAGHGGNTTGIWSLNPNEWPMTAEEALAYEQAKADAANYETQVNPSTLDKVESTIGGVLSVAKLGIFAFIGFKVYDALSKRGKTA